jgi:hypothetical protein
MVIKEGLSKVVLKKQLPKITTTIEKGVTVFNGYPKTVKTIANSF